ncbi:10605_t:CDS:10, partial [Dentiscutata erythropus]
MQQQSNLEIPSFAISHISEYFQFNCEKLLRKIGNKNYEPKKNKEANYERKVNKKQNLDHSTLKEASQNRGIKFETKVRNELKNVTDYKNKYKSPAEARKILIDAQAGQFLYQLKFEIPDDLYDKLRIKNIIKLSPFVPDFIQVVEEGGEKQLMIWDAKAAKKIRYSHKFQVASYAYLLDHITKYIPGISISRMCGIFLPSTDGIKSIKKTFSIDFMLPRVDRFLSEKLPRIVSASEVPWHYNHSCKTCEFVKDCREDAKGTIAMIPYLSADDASYLKLTVQKNKLPNKNEVDIEDLANYVNNCQVDRKVKQIIRYDEKRKKSPYLEYKPENAQFIGWAIQLCTDSGKIIKKFSNLKSEKDETLSSFISLMSSFVTHLEKVFKYLCRKKSRACIFVYSEQEKILIQDSLLRLITLDPDKISKVIQHKAMQCLLNLFEDCSLLLAIKNDDNENSKIPDGWREFPRLIVLEHSLRENVAINVPGFYLITDVWEQMVKPKYSNLEEIKNLDPDAIQSIDLEYIYATWESVDKKKVNLRLKGRCYFFNIAYYDLLKEFTNEIESILIFYPQNSRKRADRLKDFIQGEVTCGILLKFDNIVEKNYYNEEVTAQFIIVCDEKSHKLEKSSFTDFILTEDSEEGTCEAICFSDMEYKNKFSDCPLPVLALIKVDNNSKGITIHLKGKFQKNVNGDPKEFKLRKDAKYRLYKRYLDFNTDKILKMLIDIYKQENSLFLDILKDPNAWSFSLPEIPKSKCDSFSMSSSQKTIPEALLEKRLQIVWGPPGSGKTHFLATKVIPWLVEKKENTIIGITANTNTAIDNLLKRIGVQKQKHNKMNDFLLLRMNTSSSRSSNSNDIKFYKPEELGEIIKYAGKPIVVGGTIWVWHKIHKNKYCDIMIIDEGSQLLVSDACVALECLNQANGKLIIAGDHMQLGPIIKNTYPAFSDDHPLIFGSIQQCLMRKNCNLNSFFKKIYGDDYESVRTSEWDFKNDNIKNPVIKQILSPGRVMTLVKLNNHDSREKSELLEADVVAEIVSAYFDANKSSQSSLFIVTPQHSQRLAIQSRVGKYLSNNNLKIDTVDKMQGQEADLVIACFGFHDNNEIARKSNFLFDPNRWNNVAISRA